MPGRIATACSATAACTWVCMNATMPSPAPDFRAARPGSIRLPRLLTANFEPELISARRRKPAPAAAARSGRATRSRCWKRALTRPRPPAGGGIVVWLFLAPESAAKRLRGGARILGARRIRGFARGRQPYPHLPLTSDHLDLAFHQRRTFDAPLLVFECADITDTIARLRELDVSVSAHPPRGVERARGI